MTVAAMLCETRWPVDSGVDAVAPRSLPCCFDHVPIEQLTEALTG